MIIPVALIFVSTPAMEPWVNRGHFRYQFLSFCLSACLCICLRFSVSVSMSLCLCPSVCLPPFSFCLSAHPSAFHTNIWDVSFYTWPDFNEDKLKRHTGSISCNDLLAKLRRQDITWTNEDRVQINRWRSWLATHTWTSIHYSDVMMSAMAFQITGVSIVCSTVCSGADKRKHESSGSLSFVRGIHRWPVNSPHKGPVTRIFFPFADVIMTADFWSDRVSLRWRHNGRDSASNRQPHDCLLKRLFRRRSKKTSMLRVTGLCAGNSPGTGEFPAQMASNAENVSFWWRHHVICFSRVTKKSSIHTSMPTP